MYIYGGDIFFRAFQVGGIYGRDGKESHGKREIPVGQFQKSNSQMYINCLQMMSTFVSF